MTNYTIKFGKSTSANYEVAVDISSRFNTYKVSGEGKSIIHEVNFSDSELHYFFELYEIVGRWKSTSIFIDGERILSTNSHFIRCFKDRQDAYNKSDYCFNKDDGNPYNDNYFGCKYVTVNPSGWKGLEGYGDMNPNGTFYVNKDKMKHELEISLKNFGSCPAFDYSNMISLLDKIPNQINPKTNKGWTYVTDYVDGNEIARAVKFVGDKQNGPILNSYRRDVPNDRVTQRIERNSSTQQPKGCAGALLLGLSPLVITLLYKVFL
ncbi:hypothetical protein [Lysinibacillus sphaericus]|uniref:hypothetical protein n=1 Tax=Lysinibacillus sphaericus TaxID=1421 RepID=UPI001A9E516C|nr:hypothetical protein [Lysinibacillus sphaericus]QTB25236.1 hypothetical protein J2D51_12775 [Lysinibacillus sphaericus]